MSENNVGANLMFALRTTIVCEPKSEENVSNSFSNIHRFDTGFCSEGEHKVRPYIGFAHRFDTGFCSRRT